MDDYNFSITISEESANMLYDMNGKLLETKQRIDDANKDLSDKLKDVGFDLGKYQDRVEEVISISTKASDDASEAFGALAKSLVSVADWIMAKCS